MHWRGCSRDAPGQDAWKLLAHVVVHHFCEGIVGRRELRFEGILVHLDVIDLFVLAVEPFFHGRELCHLLVFQTVLVLHTDLRGVRQVVCNLRQVPD